MTAPLRLLLLLLQGSSAALLACRSELDCNLNGVCSDGRCLCDAPWAGPVCGRLRFAPVPMARAFEQSYGDSVRLHFARLPTGHLCTDLCTAWMKLKVVLHRSRCETTRRGAAAWSSTATSTTSSQRR